MEKDLALPERIRGVGAVLLFLQYWHQWILDNPRYTLKNNFITHDYLCKEINAHDLLSYLFLCQDHSLPFQPRLLGSQPCEQAFRAAWSMNSVFSSVVNFSLLGLLCHFHHLQIQVSLESESSATGIVYPRREQHPHKQGISSDAINSEFTTTTSEGVA